MPSILKKVTNIAMVSPIAGQYPEKITSSGDELATEFPAHDETNILPAKRKSVETLSYTDATMLFVQNRKRTAVPPAYPGVPSFAQHKAKPYVRVPGKQTIGVLGIAAKYVATSGSEYEAPFLGESLDNFLSVSLSSKGSTMLAAYVNAVENMNVKVQNSFNRPLPFNTYTRDERIALLYNYHADLFELELLINEVAGLVSWIYHASSMASVDLQDVPSLYSPLLFSKMLSLYGQVKQFPVLDSFNAGRVQRFSHYYSASKRRYFPGAYHKIDQEIPAGNISMTAGTGVNTSTITSASSLALRVSSEGVYTPIVEGRLCTADIHRMVATNALEDVLDVAIGVCAAITSEYSKVIQFCIQATAKGIFTFSPLAKFLDFDEEGLFVMDIVKDYQINNLIRALPQIASENGNDSNINYKITPNAVSYDDSTYKRAMPLSRYVGPYVLGDDVYTSYEMLSAGAWNCSEFDDVEEVTGLQSRIQQSDVNYGVRLFYATSAQIRVPLLSNTFAPVLTATDSDTFVVLASTTALQIRQAVKLSFILQEVVDQFDLWYQTLQSTDTSNNNMSLIATDLEEDSYFLEVADSVFETPNADVYASTVELVTWLEGVHSSRSARKAGDHGQGKDSGSSSDKDKS